MRSRFGLSVLVLLSLAACDAPAPADTLIFVAPENEAVIRAYVERLPEEIDAGVRVTGDPVAAMARRARACAASR